MNKIITVEMVVDHVCNFFSIDTETFTKKSRKREFVIPRQVIATILVLNGYSSSKSGLAIGRDHATVLHAKNTIMNLLDPKYKTNDTETVRQCLLSFKRRYPYTNLHPLQGDWGTTYMELQRAQPRQRKVYYILPSMQGQRKSASNSNHKAVRTIAGNIYNL